MKKYLPVLFGCAIALAVSGAHAQITWFDNYADFATAAAGLGLDLDDASIGAVPFWESQPVGTPLTGNEFLGDAHPLTYGAPNPMEVVCEQTGPIMVDGRTFTRGLGSSSTDDTVGFFGTEPLSAIGVWVVDSDTNYSGQEIIEFYEQRNADVTSFMWYIMPVADRFGERVYDVAAASLAKSGLEVTASQLKSLAQESQPELEARSLRPAPAAQ